MYRVATRWSNIHWQRTDAVKVPSGVMMVTLGMPSHECCCLGFVIPRLTPSDGLRRWPVTNVCLNFLRCAGVKGMT